MSKVQKIVFVEITHQKEKIETPAQFTVEELMALLAFFNTEKAAPTAHAIAMIL